MAKPGNPKSRSSKTAKSKSAPKTQSTPPQTPASAQTAQPVNPPAPAPTPTPAPAPAPIAPAAVASDAPVSKTARRKAVPSIPPPPILDEGDVSPAHPGGGPGDRYVLGPSPETVAPFPGRALPTAYGTGRLLLVARDPRWLYAHWDLTDTQLQDYNRQSASGHLWIRVHQGAIGPTPTLEQAVHPESRNWFLHVPKSGVSYLAELGYRDRSGVWQQISQSGSTLTPADEMSTENWVRFETVPFEVPREKVVELIKEAASSSPGIQEAVFGQAPTPAPATPNIAIQASPRPTAPSDPTHRASPRTQVPVPAWTPEQERALAEIINIDEVRRIWIGSLEITELLRRQLVRDLSRDLSSVALQRAPGAAGEQGPGLGGQTESSLSSPFGDVPAAGRGFRFEVNAELIVYGATEPDATVTIGGRRIQLRPDGSFSYRFALPDGQYALPIVATSADAVEQRSADLSFARGSVYQGGVGTHPQDEALRVPAPENVS